MGGSHMKALFLLLVFVPGCAVALGDSACERRSEAIHNAADRCGFTIDGTTCENVLAIESSESLDDCITWFETGTCEDLRANQGRCKISLLVSPL